MHTQERIDFINALEIDPVAAERALSSRRIVGSSDKASAAVVGSSLISFVDKLDEQSRACLLIFFDEGGGQVTILFFIQNDVMNSTLLAQLGADARFSKTKQTDRWYEKYQETLGKVGWVTKNFK